MIRQLAMWSTVNAALDHRGLLAGLTLLLCAPSALESQKLKPLPIIMTSAVVADCASTIWFRHNEPWKNELNPLLGKKPSDFRIITTCLAGIVFTNVVGSKLHNWPKPVFYLTLTAISINQSLHNRYNIGIYIPF